MTEKPLILQVQDELLDGSLDDIIEMTYAYDIRDDGTFFNRTLFIDFIDTSSCRSYEAYMECVGQKLNNYLTKIEQYIHQLDTGHDGSYIAIILHKYLEYVHDILTITLLALPFELEKAGLCSVDFEQAQQKHTEISLLEEKRFGPMVSAESHEVSASYFLLYDLLQANSQALTEDEQERYISYIDQIKTLETYDASYEDANRPSHLLSHPPLYELDTMLGRDEYVKLFRAAFDFYGISKKIVVDTTTSMYDGQDAFHIPKSSAYEFLPLLKVLALLVHEIETHYIIQHNTEFFLGEIQGANNLIREEGLASFHEDVFVGQNPFALSDSVTNAQILLGELLVGKAYEDFLYLLFNVIGQKEKAAGYFLRRKRNYSLHYPGVQHKDMSYARGKKQVKEYLRAGGDFKKLFYAKVDFQDIQLIDKRMTSGRLKQLFFPQFLGERLLFELLGNSYDEKLFREYLQKKYHFIDFSAYPFTGYSAKQEQLVAKMLEICTTANR